MNAKSKKIKERKGFRKKIGKQTAKVERAALAGRNLGTYGEEEAEKKGERN